MSKTILPPTTARKRELDARARACGWQSHSQLETAIIDGQVDYPPRPAGFLPFAERKRQEEQWLRAIEIHAAMNALGYRVSDKVAILDALKTLGIRVFRVRPNANASRFRETARRVADVLGIERD